MATAKKAAKKAVPKKIEAPKQIVMTQEQYDELVRIKYSLDCATDSIKELATNDEHDVNIIGFKLGEIYTDLLKAYGTSNELVDNLDPELYGYVEEEFDNDPY